MFNGTPALLRVELEVWSDDESDWPSRWLYNASIFLFRVGHPGLMIGRIAAWRIHKPTSQHPNVGDKWVHDWLRVPLAGDGAIRAAGQPLAWPMQSVWNQNGQPRDEVNEWYQDQLDDDGNEILFITEIVLTYQDSDTGETVSQDAPPPRVDSAAC